MIYTLRKSESTPAHIDTTWYIVVDSHLQDYETNHIEKKVTNEDNKDIVSFSIPVDGKYLIAIKRFDDGSVEKIEPMLLKDYVEQGSFSIQSPVETPILNVASNTFGIGSGNVVIQSSTIMPSSTVLDKLVWVVVNNDSGEIIYSDLNNKSYSFTLDTSKGISSSMRRVSVYCAHISLDGTCSKQGHASFELSKNDIVVNIQDNLNPNIPNPLSVSSDLSIITKTAFIITKDNETIYAGKDTIPINILNYSSEYNLIVDVYYSTNGVNHTTTKQVSFTTTENAHRSDVLLTKDPIIKSVKVDSAITGVKSALLTGNEIANGLLVAPNTVSVTSDGVLTRTISISGDQIPQSVEISRYEDSWISLSGYDKTTSKLSMSNINIPNMKDTLIRSIGTSTTSQSSNVAMLNNSEIYFVNNNSVQKLVSGTATLIKELPSSSYDDSQIPFRVEFLNGSELYIITNTGTILLFNIISKEFDILNRFVPKSEFMTSTLSDGGLIILNGYNETIVYNKKKDTLTATVENTLGLITEINGAVTKILKK